jgi:excisionase family DNA binding protein
VTHEATNGQPASHVGATSEHRRLVAVATHEGSAPPATSASAHRLELLTLDELVTLLKVRKSWLYDEVEAGRLPAVRLGRQLRFRVADVEAYLIRAASA